MQIEDLKVAFPTLNIETHVDLSAYTNTRVGGVADGIFWPASKEELIAVVKYASEHDLPVLVLGNASNLIITDEGVRGLVIFLTHLTDITVTDTTITAAAGAAIIAVSEQAQREGLTGLEWAAGIPGSVGGAVYMNAGAYGGQVDGCLATADILHPNGEIETLTSDQLEFGYRHSVVQGTGDVILSATFELVPGDHAKIRETMEDFNERRASKQPLEYPSCGSVFKRPEGHFAGKLIMDAGLQGFTIGGAQVSRKHAGFIVNFNDATSADYVGVIHHVQKVVFEQTGISLETEVRILGE
ncbi:UDP-N-acetylmuramate dehydrogenase [Weissella ceti]|uniref:UDP-N-acetylenolpyruvoylglucosamine reductase n=1 Tax=Weissella ceti TaxID=759620 RepID=A0ABT3E5F9_9LACO|nr:UDP-N-acetylmuramate dehydrogenase [Weissella ceti]MCW0953637.1 UDP-N-acetylmuramate dehydrogenase [Weissella ceti]QVK12278.1 UDP-N-acetylmuramate dehydrogenase [Weissella ceti]